MPHFVEEQNGQPLSQKKILFADDNTHLRTLVTMMLEELGADVTSVVDGKNALVLYAADPKAYDLVLLDVRMKGLDGRSTFDKLLEMDPSVKVVLYSGILPDKELKEKLRDHGGGFIEKPFNLEGLEKVLMKVPTGTATF